MPGDGQSSVLLCLAISAALFAIAFSCKSFLRALLLTGFQIESVPFDLLDDVLLKDFALKALERALQAFPVVNLNFSQWNSPRNVEVDVSA